MQQRRILLAIAAVGYLTICATLIWLYQPPFQLQRKLVANLPFTPRTLLPTDLDADGHPEILAVSGGLPFWVRSPFHAPSVKVLSEYEVVWLGYEPVETPMKAVPVRDRFNNLRLLRWLGGKAVLKAFPNSPSFVSR